MSDEDIKRLEQIAQRQWQRTLDDQIGISWVEKSRAAAPAPLPVWEPLLADKSVHQIPWPQGKTPQETWQEASVSRLRLCNTIVGSCITSKSNGAP